MSENSKNECRCVENRNSKATAGTCKEHGKYMGKEMSSRRRKRIAWLVICLMVSTTAMVAFIHYEQMTYPLGMAFNAPLAAVLGYNMK